MKVNIVFEKQDGTVISFKEMSQEEKKQQAQELALISHPPKPASHKKLSYTSTVQPYLSSSLPHWIPVR